MNHDWVRANFPQMVGLQPLANGGQKVVYAGVHGRHGRSVLKLIRPSNHRLDRELEAVARVQSEYVPRIFETGTTATDVGDVVWLCEQFVEGAVLRGRLVHGPLNATEMLRLAHDLTRAAADAQKVNVVHRDIKPENIILGTHGRTWLLDFGIARVLDMSSMTPTAQPYGPCTPGYAAPEQVRNRKSEIDGRADLFSIGVVLHECAIGHNVFRVGARNDQEIFLRTERMALPRLRLAWDRNQEYAEFVSALTQKYRGQRPGNCEEAHAWAKDLATTLGGPT